MSEKSKSYGSGAGWKKWIILTVILLVVAGGITAAVHYFGETKSDTKVATAFVQRGPMVISVTEGGEIESERRTNISNELQWPVIIREVVDEGTLVKKGQTIIEFECKELLDEITQEELEVTSSENSFTQAEQNLQLKKEEMNNNMLQAKRKLDEAREDQTKYIKHEYPILVFERDNAVKTATEELEIARHKLDSKKTINNKMKEDSPYSANEIRAEELALQRMENTLNKSELEKKKLDLYDHPRKLRDLEAQVSDAELAYRRAELEARSQLLMVEADVQAKKRAMDMHHKKLDELKTDKGKLIVKAKEEGLVVYQANRRHGNTVVIAKGEKINPRQQLMMIPDMSTIQVKTKVYEAVISKVKPGLEAFVILDVAPNKPIKGKVKKVAVLPDSQNSWLTPDLKTFDVIIDFDDKVNKLKPGMTCQAELVINKLADAIMVPMAAVFHEKDKTVCYLAGSGKPVDVKIGEMNTTHAQILSGLNEGDEVMLVKPNSNEQDAQKDEKIDKIMMDKGAGA